MDYIYIDIDTTSELIKNAKSLNDIKILFYIIEKMNCNTGEIIVPNVMISNELKMNKSLVSRALKNLVKNNIIFIKDGTEKRKVKTYILNEKYFKYGR